MILLNGVDVITRFPNGEACINKNKIREERFNNTIELKYESDADLFDLLLLRKSVWFPVILKMPYMPYSRMDRNSKEYVFTLKALGKFINWLDFERIIIYEPHSDVSPAIMNHVEIRYLIPDLLEQADFNKERDVALFPDTTAHKRYSSVVKAKRELVGLKTRDFVTGKITGMKIVGMDWDGNDLTGHRVVIIDDLCSKGGTFMAAAQALQILNPSSIDLVVAHCEKNIFNGELLKSELITTIYTTNTILNQADATDKLKIVELL